MRLRHWRFNSGRSSAFVLYARNPRKNDAAVDRMCSSIREFGFKLPVLARDRDFTLCSGAGRKPPERSFTLLGIDAECNEQKGFHCRPQWKISVVPEDHSKLISKV